MAFVGTILQEILKFSKNRREKRVVLSAQLQDQTLRKLMRKAQFTQFGQKNDFSRLLKTRNITHYFNQNVPVYDYDRLYNEWWHKTVQGEENVCWPGKIKYFALTSGTSGAASKRVPVSREMIRQIRKTSIRQMMSIPDFGVSPEFYQKSLLGIGGSTTLKKTNSVCSKATSAVLSKAVCPYGPRVFINRANTLPRSKTGRKNSMPWPKKHPNGM